MKCKFCQAELQTNSSVCPACGKDNLKDELKGLKVTALVLACTLMLVVLVSLVYYGVTGNFIFDFAFNKTEPVTHQVSTADGIVTMTDKELAKNMDAVVVTMGEHTMTNRELQLYYWMAAYSYTGEADLSKPLDQQIYNKETNQTYEEYFLEKAVEAWQEVTLMSAAAKEANYEMPEDYKEYLAGMKEEILYYVEIYKNYYGYPLENEDDFIQMQFGPGCDFQTYYDYSYDYYLGGLYWADMMMGLDVTDAELETYFTENEESLAKDYAISITKDYGELVDIRVLTVGLITKEVEDADGKKTTVEDWDATLEKVEGFYDQWLAGEKTEDAFIELVKKNSNDDSTASTGGMYSDLYKGSLAEVDVRHILIQPEGGQKDENGNTTYTDEAWADAYAKAEDILNQWLAGEMTEEAFGTLAKEHSSDSNASRGGLYTDIYVGKMVKEFEDWCFDASRQTGDYGIVKTMYGYHIMYFVHGDTEADHWTFDENRQAGDVTYVKTDAGYVMMYYVTSEEAWVRYCRYGVQSEKAADMLEQLVADNAYTVDDGKVALAQME